MGKGCILYRLCAILTKFLLTFIENYCTALYQESTSYSITNSPVVQAVPYSQVTLNKQNNSLCATLSIKK